MFKRLGKDAYICDTVEDLKTISETELGAECYVIKNSAQYRLMSNGEWVKQVPAESGSAEVPEVDLTDYATKEYTQQKADAVALTAKNYTDEKVGSIKIPSISNFVKKDELQGYATEVELELVKSNPIFKMFDTETYTVSQYTFFLKAEEGKTLADAMKEKGLGFYTFWMEKGHTDLPAAMNQANLSGRGFCCLDYFASETDYIGWIVMFNKNNEIYYRFISHAVAGPWMKIATTE